MELCIKWLWWYSPNRFQWSQWTFKTHWPLENLNEILDLQFSNIFEWLIVEASLVRLPYYACYWTSLMISQHWLRWWLGVVRPQAIAWAYVDPDLCRRRVSLGPNELSIWKDPDIFQHAKPLLWRSPMLYEHFSCVFCCFLCWIILSKYIYLFFIPRMYI